MSLCSVEVWDDGGYGTQVWIRSRDWLRYRSGWQTTASSYGLRHVLSSVLRRPFHLFFPSLRGSRNTSERGRLAAALLFGGIIMLSAMS